MTSLTLDKYGDPITIEEFRGMPAWLLIPEEFVERDLRTIMEHRIAAPGMYRVFLQFRHTGTASLYDGVWIQRDIEVYGPGPNRYMIGFVEVKGEIDNES
jgi:hypothetical protein